MRRREDIASRTRCPRDVVGTRDVLVRSRHPDAVAGRPEVGTRDACHASITHLRHQSGWLKISAECYLVCSAVRSETGVVRCLRVSFSVQHGSFFAGN